MGQLVARATLCIITAVAIVLYSIALYTAHVRPLPEQQWIRGALLLVILFQDPGLFLRFVMGGSSGKDVPSHHRHRSEVCCHAHSIYIMPRHIVLHIAYARCVLEKSWSGIWKLGNSRNTTGDMAQVCEVASLWLSG